MKEITLYKVIFLLPFNFNCDNVFYTERSEHAWMKKG